jgi:hypothetical protein
MHVTRRIHMSLTEKILEDLKPVSRNQKVRRNEGYLTGSAFFDVVHFDRVVDVVTRVIEPIITDGEKILNRIEGGKIFDSGEFLFQIKRGVFFEVYDYRELTATFIRLYHLFDPGSGNEWLALYIDENPSTPWWSKGERE